MRNYPLIVAALLSLPAALAHADPIAGRVGGTAFEDYGGTSVGASWTQTGTYTDVSIAAVILAYQLTPATDTVYLTNHIGPGTTDSNTVASTVLTSTSGNNPTALFSGLTLGPGTYFLVTNFINGAGGISWPVFQGNTDIASPGNTTDDDLLARTGNALPPASTFQPQAYGWLDFSVNGTPVTPTPEPATLALLSTGLLGLATRLRSTR